MDIFQFFWINASNWIRSDYINGVFNIHFLGAIIDLIFVIFALIDNRMLGKILAIMASAIIFGSLILDFFVLYDFAIALTSA